MSIRSRIADLPVLVIGVLLLSTAADILPNDTIVGVGEVQLNLARLLALVGLGAFVAAHGLRADHWRTGYTLPLLLLLGVALYSSHKYGTYPRYRFLVEGVAVFYLVFAVVRAQRDGRDVLATVGLIALSVAALAAVAQVAQGVHTGFYRDGCTPVTLTPAATPPSGSLPRATGTFSNPNVLGGYLLLLLPIGAMAWAYVARVRGIWAALALGCGFGFLALVFTFSRAAILASLVAIAAGILVSDLRYRRWLILVVAAAGAAIAGRAGGGGAAAAGARIAVRAGGCGWDATASYGRAEEWQATIDVIRDNPVWGVGLGRLGAVRRPRDPQSCARHAHNLFLTWWAGAGPGALIAWVWLYLLLLWRSLPAALRTSSTARTAIVA